MDAWNVNDIPNQSGRTILITGANSGLGYETTLALAGKQAQIVMACRNQEKGQQARAKILQLVPDAKIELMSLDLESLAAIRDFAAAFKAKHTRLDLLINNAGVMAPPRRETKDGFESQIGTNHLGHFALTGLLLDLLITTPGSRIVTVSSVAHRTGRIKFDDLQRKQSYSRYGAYGQSKLANLLFAFELQRKLEAAGSKTLSLAAHPGYSDTNLQSNTATATKSSLEGLFYNIGNSIMAQSSAMGVLPQLHAATAPEVKGGQFYGPGFMGLRGYPKLEVANAPAYDKAVAARLWQVSSQLTGVNYEALVSGQVGSISK